MGRTPGAKNKTAREWEALGKWCLEKAKLMRQNEALKAAVKSAPKKTK